MNRLISKDEGLFFFLNNCHFRKSQAVNLGDVTLFKYTYVYVCLIYNHFYQMPIYYILSGLSIQFNSKQRQLDIVRT